jgi:heme-degrading monooxygenase HmoA
VFQLRTSVPKALVAAAAALPLAAATSARPYAPDGAHDRANASSQRDWSRKETIAMNPEPVVLINAFEVPAGEDEAFLRGWKRAQGFLRAQDGYLSARLHRSVSPNADFRFVNVALWQSPESFRAATSQPEFRDAPFPFPFHASLYEVVRDDER